MANVKVTPPYCGTIPFCTDKFNCSCAACPDFVIKRHDTKPCFCATVSDANGSIDLTGLILEASMWCNAKLKTAIGIYDASIALADNIGFQQILPNDIILMDRVRSPEQMQVTSFDEVNGLVNVTRGYNSTTPSAWNKGQRIRIFRFMSSPGVTEMVYDDVLQVDGCTENQLIKSNLTYEWQPNDTCVPGCFFLEFKLMKMGANVPALPPPECAIGAGVEWVRRFPIEGEGFVVKIVDSPTFEL